MNGDIPLRRGNCCNSASTLVRYLEEPCDRFCLRFSEPDAPGDVLFLNGSILSTKPGDNDAFDDIFAGEGRVGACGPEADYFGCVGVLVCL